MCRVEWIEVCMILREMREYLCPWTKQTMIFFQNRSTFGLNYMENHFCHKENASEVMSRVPTSPAKSWTQKWPGGILDHRSWSQACHPALVPMRLLNVSPCSWFGDCKALPSYLHTVPGSTARKTCPPLTDRMSKSLQANRAAIISIIKSKELFFISKTKHKYYLKVAIWEQKAHDYKQYKGENVLELIPVMLTASLKPLHND